MAAIKDKLVTLEGLKAVYDKLKALVTTSAPGLMSAEDKVKLNGVETGAQVNAVTSVKGSAESTGNVGDVSISAADVGALPISGGTMTGDINLGQAGASAGSKNLKMTTADNTLWQIRTYGNNLQLARTLNGGTTANMLSFASDGTMFIANTNVWRSTLEITPGNIGAKGIQTAKSSPSASGTAAAFIDTISQDAQGVITATKKSVTPASIGLGSATMNFAVGRFALSPSKDMYSLRATVDNSSNSSKHGHDVSVNFQNDGVYVFDHTGGINASYKLMPPTLVEFTPEENVEIIRNNSYRIGNVVIVSMLIRTSAAFSGSSASPKLLTFPSGIAVTRGSDITAFQWNGSDSYSLYATNTYIGMNNSNHTMPSGGYYHLIGNISVLI